LRTVEASTPTGPVRLPSTPPRWSDAEPFAPGPVPALGQHTQAIRAEFA
jgi:crotonobetainyl-CoA:carnitine CoA-transferase CaiB-like acyl-CoA transferase